MPARRPSAPPPILLLLALLARATAISGQDADAWRARFAAGQEALNAGDHGRYAAEMGAAAEAMPDGHLSRPFVQYHAARAAALASRPEEAAGWLRRAWEEDIESFMISFAEHDAAFDAMRGNVAFARLMASLGSRDLGVRALGPNLHLLEGAGANLLVQTGREGAVLVDTGYGAALPAVLRALASLDAGPVRYVLITHPHEDHMGGAAGLVRATTLAHARTADAMAEPYVFIEGVEVPPKRPAARPDVTVEGDTTLVLNGEQVRVAVLEAHTDADLAVYFTGARVAHLGDLYLAGNPMMFPGSEDPDGFLARLEAFLDGLDPEAVVVGGHDEPVDAAAVRAQIVETRACMAYVREAIAAGQNAEQVVGAAPERFPPRWVRFFHGALTAER